MFHYTLANARARVYSCLLRPGRLLAGEAIEAVRLHDLRLLVLEERAGGLVLAEAGARGLGHGAGVGAVRLGGVLRAHALGRGGGLTSKERGNEVGAEGKGESAVVARRSGTVSAEALASGRRCRKDAADREGGRTG